MFGPLLALLVVWVVVALIGALVEGLFWLTVVGTALFLVTGAVVAVRSLDPTFD
jgi:hypothetical protein